MNRTKLVECCDIIGTVVRIYREKKLAKSRIVQNDRIRLFEISEVFTIKKYLLLNLCEKLYT